MKYNAYAWIVRVLNSCETFEQFYNAIKLIDLFFNMYCDTYLWIKLVGVRTEKFNELNQSQKTYEYI